MSQFRDVIARMAVDAEFARHARSHPDQVASEYGLSSEETDRLRGLADASAGTGPQALGVRLSKSGVTTGGLAAMLSGGGTHDLPGADHAPAHHVSPQVLHITPGTGEHHDSGGPSGGGVSSPEIGSTHHDPAPPPSPAPAGVHLTPTALHGGGGNLPGLPDFPGLPGGGNVPGLPDFPGLPGGGETPPVLTGLDLGGQPSFHLPVLPGGSEVVGPGVIQLPGGGIFTDTDGDGIPDVIDPTPGGDPAPPSGGGMPGDMFGDNDGDGIPNFIDPTPDGDPTPPPPSGGGGGLPGDMFGDNDGDGIPNFIDPTPDGDPTPPPLWHFPEGVFYPGVIDPGDSGDPGPADPGGDLGDPPIGDPPLADPGSPDASDPGMPPADPGTGSSGGGGSNSGAGAAAGGSPDSGVTDASVADPTADSSIAAASQPPTPPPAGGTGGIDSTELAVGAGALAAGVIAGGVAGGVAGAAMARKKSEDDGQPPT